MQFFVHGIDETFSQQLQVGRQVVGRNSETAIRLYDSSVSKTHAEIVLKENGVIGVQDLNSTNGTFVNGKKVRQASVSPGQELRFGNVRAKIDNHPVRVVIPKIEPQKQPQPSWMPDGKPACLLHPGFPAVYRCAQCGHALCQRCGRQVGLIGKQPKLFCAVCSGDCLSLKNKTEKDSSSAIRLKKMLKKLDRFFASKR